MHDSASVTGSGLVDRNGTPLQDYSEFNKVVDYLTLMICTSLSCLGVRSHSLTTTISDDTYGPG